MIVLKKSILAAALGIGLWLPASAQETDTIPPPIGEQSKLNAVVLHYDAVRARNKGDNTEAEARLREAIKFDPEGAGLYYDLARINMARRQMAEAEKHIKKAIELEPENNWYIEQYAGLLLEENKFTEAAELYEQIVAKDEHNKEYLQTIAYLYQRAGEKKKAAAAYEKLVRMYGNDEEILEGKLQMHLNNNELDEAVKVNNRLIELAPGESRYYIRMAEMYNNNDKPDKAAEVYKKAEEMFPDDAGIQLSLSEYYRRKGDKENYKKYLQKVVKNNALGASEQLTVLAGFVMAAEDSADKALGLVLAKDIATAHPEDANAIASYGDMLGITGNLAGATEQYKKSVDIEPANYPVWKNLLSAYLQAEMYDSALKYGERALRLFPNQAQLHYMSGIAYSLKKDYQKAVNAIERAADMMPEENKGELAGMYGMLADAYYNLKDYEASDGYFEKSLKLAPDNPTTLNNYAYYLSERGERLNDAERMSKRSLELAPELPTFLDTYGWILYKQGNYKKAKEYIEKAIQKEEEGASGTLWDHLGDANYQLGNRDEALGNWKKAKELGADNPNLDKKIADNKLYE